MRLKPKSIIIILMSCFACGPSTKPTETTMPETTLKPIFVGAYTRDEGFVNGQSAGIQLIWQNSETGILSNPSIAYELINPSFLAKHPNGKVLYAVSELARTDEPTGFLYSFSIGSDQSLTQVSKIETIGQAPCHVSADQSGKYVFVANYLGGVIKMYATSSKGELSESDQILLKGSGSHPNQDASHTHMVRVSPDNKFLYVPDLGSNRIWSFRINHETGKLIPSEVPFTEMQDGAGPRHMDFHPDGKSVFVINELDATITAYSYNSETGELDLIQTVSTLPEDFDGANSCADIHVHPSGKFVYGSNRGHDSIVIFKIAESGQMTYVGHTSTRGSAPRNFTLDSEGNFLYVANQNSNNVMAFRIDQETGTLTELEKLVAVKTPVCLVW